MTIQNTTLIPAAIEVIKQVSDSDSAPFWDGLLAVTESLDTVRSAKNARALVIKRLFGQLLFWLYTNFYAEPKRKMISVKRVPNAIMAMGGH